MNFELSPLGEVVVRAAELPHRRVKSSRFAKYRGKLRTGQSADALIRLLRGYDEDLRDPGIRGG